MQVDSKQSRCESLLAEAVSTRRAVWADGVVTPEEEAALEYAWECVEQAYPLAASMKVDAHVAVRCIRLGHETLFDERTVSRIRQVHALYQPPSQGNEKAPEGAT